MLPKWLQWLALTTILLLLSQASGTGPAPEHDESSIKISEYEEDTYRVTVPVFVATNEWQELLPGQGVPRGLHVRLNIETGKREAKLVENYTAELEEPTRAVVARPNTHKTTITAATDISGDVLEEEIAGDALTATDDMTTYDDFEKETGDIKSAKVDQDQAPPVEPNWNHDKIYGVLQALPEPPKIDGMDINEAHEKLTHAEFRKQIVTLWKKRQVDLKEALESLQDDAKYLVKLLEQFKEAEQKGDTESQISVLKVLEWEVQDLDKTHVFNFIEGFRFLAEILNSTNLPIRASAAWIIGSAAKNYRDGQEWAIDAGVVPMLIESFNLKTPITVEAANDVLEVKKKSIYALSSIVRSNTRGQRLFLLYNAPNQLGRMFDDAQSAKLQLKILLFVYDLMAEASDMKLHHAIEPELSELKKIFHSTQWCERFKTTFVKMAPQLVHREMIELVDAMRFQLPTCQPIYRASGVKSVVKTLAKRLSEDSILDAEEKKELALFFEDFIVHL